MSGVSVILPHRDDLQNLALCLALLRRQTVQDFDIVVADNGSACGLRAVRDVCGPDATLVSAPTPGAAHARNAALAVARGDALAFIDSDCRPSETWLENGLKTLKSGVIVAGRVEVLFADPAHPTAAEAYEAVFAFDNRRYVARDFCLGCNMFARRADFDRVGLFRAGAPEDLDWSRRARRCGLRLVYDARVVVGHPARRDWPALARKNKRVVGELFWMRRDQGALAWAVYLAALAASPLVHAPRLAFSRKFSGLRLKAEAIALLFRLRWRRLSWFLELLRA